MAGISPMPGGVATPQDLAVALRYGPQTEQALRRSSYLTDALRQLTVEGSQNIHSGGELAAKLLASAILQRGASKGQDAVMSAMRADQQSADTSLLADTPLGISPPAPAPAAPMPPPQVQPQAETPPPPPAPTGPVPQETPAQTAQFSPQDRDALTHMLAVEAGGEGPTGMAAAGHVAMNRLKARYGGAKSLSDVIYQPHQFTGMAHGHTPSAAELASAGQVADGILSGQVPDPTSGAMAFLNPDLTQKLYGHIPAWAQGGNGQRIGNHVFFGGGQQVAQNASPPPGPAGPDAVDPGPSGSAPPPAAFDAGAIGAGADPSPVSAPAQSPAAQPPSMGVPSPPAAVRASGGVPHQMVTPEEWHVAASLLHDPRTREIGVQQILKLKMRAASPVEMKPGTYFGEDGNPHSVEQFQDQPAAPNAFVQRSTLDNHITAQGNPSYGALPAGTVMSPKGGISQVPIEQQKTFRIPGVSGVFVSGPDGRPAKVGDDQYGPEQLLKMRENLLQSEPVKLYQQAADAYGAMKAAAGLGMGGMRAYALRDTFARAINPGAVARAGTIQAIKESQGLPANVQSFFLNLKGDGDVPPEIAQQILDVTHGFVASHYRGAQQLVQSNTEYAKRHQIDPADVVVPLGDAPQPFRIPVAKAPPQGIQPGNGALGSGLAQLVPGGASPPVAVRTPEEARRLPRGTAIRLPDGTVGRVP